MPVPGEKSERYKRRQERIKAVNALTAVPRVRVTPAREELRNVLMHPGTGVRFRKEGSVEWPLDQFTKRRVRDGDVTIEEREANKPESNSSATAEPRRSISGRSTGAQASSPPSS